MGAITDMILDGTLCQTCAVALLDTDGNIICYGYPFECEDCKHEEQEGNEKAQHTEHKRSA